MIPVRYDFFGICREYTACVDFLRALSRDKGLDNRTRLPWRLVLLEFLKFNSWKVRFRKLSSRFPRNCSFRKMSSWEKFWRWGRVWQTKKRDKKRSIKSSTARSWSKVRSLIDSNSNSTLALFWNATMTKMVRSDISYRHFHLNYSRRRAVLKVLPIKPFCATGEETGRRYEVRFRSWKFALSLFRISGKLKMRKNGCQMLQITRKLTVFRLCWKPCSPAWAKTGSWTSRSASGNPTRSICASFRQMRCQTKSEFTTCPSCSTKKFSASSMQISQCKRWSAESTE